MHLEVHLIELQHKKLHQLAFDNHIGLMIEFL